MRFIRAFGLIGVGGFTAGIFYSRTIYDQQVGNWFIFAAAVAIAVGGLLDLVALALRSRPQRQYV